MPLRSKELCTTSSVYYAEEASGSLLLVPFVAVNKIVRCPASQYRVVPSQVVISASLLDDLIMAKVMQPFSQECQQPSPSTGGILLCFPWEGSSLALVQRAFCCVCPGEVLSWSCVTVSQASHWPHSSICITLISLLTTLRFKCLEEFQGFVMPRACCHNQSNTNNQNLKWQLFA